MERLSYLFAAYTAVWVLLFLYVQILSRRNHRMEKEIEDLRELVEQQVQRREAARPGDTGARERNAE